MLKVVGLFRLHYKGQAQGTLGSLVATPSLLSRELISKDKTQKYCPSGIGYDWICLTKLCRDTKVPCCDREIPTKIKYVQHEGCNLS